MTEHPITPPPELVEQWSTASPIQYNDQDWTYELLIAHHAAQWAADQELEACCEWLEQQTLCGHQSLIPSLRAARRPKPPSLKQRALKGLDTMIANGHLDAELAAAIREVLEASHD
jgi:hypothetical protein